MLDVATVALKVGHETRGFGIRGSPAWNLGLANWKERRGRAN